MVVGRSNGGQRQRGRRMGRCARPRKDCARRARAVAVYAFLIAVSLPIILPYFWLITIAFSARLGVAETRVLWRSMAILVPAVIAFWLVVALARNRRQMWIGDRCGRRQFRIAVFAWLVGPDLYLANFLFLWEPDFSSVVRSRVGEVKGAVQFPNVWHAFGNSVLLAGSQTAIVVTVASLAGYYLSRFQFPGRARSAPLAAGPARLPGADANRAAVPDALLHRAARQPVSASSWCWSRSSSRSRSSS